MPIKKMKKNNTLVEIIKKNNKKDTVRERKNNFKKST